MKSLLLLSFLSLALNAQEIKIHDNLTISNSIESKFNANEETGRAWVELNLIFDIEDWDDKLIRKKIKNLVYKDNEIKFLKDNGTEVTCATKGKSSRFIFLKKYTKKLDRRKLKKMSRKERRAIKKRMKLNNCDFKTRKVIKKIDNGFELIKREYTQVYLMVN